MSTTIKLDAGERHSVEAEGLSIRVEISISTGEAITLVPTPLARSKYTPRSGILVQQITGDTELIIKPANRSAFGSEAVAYSSIEVSSEGLRIEVPSLSIGEQTSASIATLFRRGGTVDIAVPLRSGPENLDRAAAAARRTVSTMSTPSQTVETSKKLSILVIVDESASFSTQLTSDLSKAITSFAGGVLGGNSVFEVDLVGTSKSSVARPLTTPENVASALEEAKRCAEIGWTRSDAEFRSDGIREKDAVVVISDDLPGELFSLSCPVHVLSPRPLTAPVGDNVTVTEFSDAFVNSVCNEESDIIREASRAMFGALTSVNEIQGV
ncbi:hypothetical protein [Corynebacterium mayonis]|uniref:hypothetical protein n=1 Tax=Corynebacterium mayonis TaxID=3062461 RepID=UPI003140079E